MRGTQFAGLLREVLDAAIAVDGGVAGAIQRLDERDRCLRFAAWRGLSDKFIQRFDPIPLVADTTCAQAHRERRRVVVRDVRVDPSAAGWAEAALEVGFIAIQSTPLIDGNRRQRGILNTHFDRPHHPATESLRELDRCAHVAGLVLQAETLAERHALGGTTLPAAAVYAIDAASRLLPTMRGNNRPLLLDTVATNLALVIDELQSLERQAVTH